MSDRACIVRAWLASPLAGDPPHLDSLLEYQLSIHHPKGVPGYKIDRKYPAPAQGELPIPMGRARVGPWLVSLCSNPILGPTAAQTVEHVAKRISAENAGLLAPGERRVIATTNSWTKSYRIPLRVRVVEWVAWIVRAEGSEQRRELLKLLRRVHALGKKVADGYGCVAQWEVEKDAPPAWWFADHDRGPVLMRTLPTCAELPAGLLGSKRDFGACAPPYWHPDRYTEIVTPC